ncbi:hypothetical protein N9A30_03100 [Flavobacteriaceae bacterium]|nr:hypothetical protein [Flavobacteriaceae bacterium]
MFPVIDILENANKSKNIKLIDRICFLIDVKNKIYDSYLDKELKKGNGVELKESSLKTLCILLKESYSFSGYKVLNSLLKIKTGILKNSPSNFNFPEIISKFIDVELEKIQLKQIISDKKLIKVNEWIEKFENTNDNLNADLNNDKVNLTFLNWNKSLGKAYSYSLIKNNFEPLSVIYVEDKYSFIQKFTQFSKRALRNLLHVYFGNKNLKLINEINIDIFDSKLKLNEIFNRIPNSSKNFKSVKGNDINEFYIINTLKNAPGDIILFSGGGLIRPKTFQLTAKKFLHIHPGLLPFVRGADCFFWSILLYGYPSCSAIFQDEGIDTGGIIHEMSFELPEFDLKSINDLKKTSNNDKKFYQIIYNSLLEFYDSTLRAITLSDILCKIRTDNIFIENLEFQKQKASEGKTFHFMHDELRNKIIKLIINR